MDYRDIIERAILTFLQAFLAVYIATSAGDLYDTSVLKTAATAGLAAVISFAYNFVKQRRQIKQ